MNYKELFKETNDEVRERYELAMERVMGILSEETVKEPYRDYFYQVSGFINIIKDLVEMVESDQLDELSMEELKELNQRLYGDIAEEAYEKSYANPAYAVKVLGSMYGQLLSFLYTEIRGMIVYAYESRFFNITINLELFVEIYNYFEDIENHSPKDVRNAIYYNMSDYVEEFIEYKDRELLDPTLSFATDIIMDSNLEDLRYLYKFGEYITENELKIAEYLNGLSQEQIDAMANTYTEGYRMGFVNGRIDLSKKSTASIRYSVGFERIVRAAIKNFEKIGLKTTIYRAPVSVSTKRQHLKTGYHATSPNKQYDYDHRFDQAIIMDKAYAERRLTAIKKSLEKYKKEAGVYAGPAVIEIFGEKPFTPVNKPECLRLDEKQQQISVNLQRDTSIISNEYLKNDEISFTIIAFPVPEIGDDFIEIFNETVRVNTLDQELYKNIQQTIIDVLDQGDYVHILGSGKNRTDFKVKLNELKNPEKETNFENCLADVNIPVGEVFTSPVLNGTNGILHVTEVYLNNLNYLDLELKFEDGKIKEYSSKNFEDKTASIQFVKENLMYNQETLPIGEFAIGTNTTAYVMARKYKIADKLPILIAEKTGPHFAVGDTCYKMSEDNRVYNPNGKEIVAKDNECSILRKTEIEKAYFNCHTDITIPYDELGEISVYTKEGNKTVIIKDGRFVLPGTEELNKAFEE